MKRVKGTILGGVLALLAASAAAQVSISVGGAGGVNVNTGGAGGVTVNTGDGVDVKTGKTSTKAASTKGNAVYTNPGQSSSTITHSPGTKITTSKDDDDDASGIRLVNGNVTIDGQKVPPSATRWTGKDGTKYRIKRSGKGNVSVEEIDE